METIFTRQNEESNINKIAAQKQLYIEAKKSFFFLLILAVPATILVALLKITLALFGIDISSIVYVYSITVIICELVLMNFVISDYRKNAAKIQEDFDCTIYDLEWHKILAGKRPKIEIINKYSEIFRNSKKDMNELVDWYPIELANKDHLTAVLLCQKTNLNYDTSVRTEFKGLIWKISIATFLILIISALVGNFSLWNFIAQFVMSFLPVFTVSAKIIIDQNKTIKNSDELREYIEGVLENIENVNQKNIRSIQDKIYNNRKDGALVPELFYRWRRKKLEAEMHKNASSY